MLTMPPGALQGQRSAGPPKVVGEILKGTVAAAAPALAEGTSSTRRRVVGAAEQPSGAPAAAAMVLAKDMVTGRKSAVGGGVSQSPKAAVRASSIPIRPKPVPPSVSRKTAAVVPPATLTDDGRKRQRPKCHRPTSTERVKVYVYNLYMRYIRYTYYTYVVISACRERGQYTILLYRRTTGFLQNTRHVWNFTHILYMVGRVRSVSVDRRATIAYYINIRIWCTTILIYYYIGTPYRRFFTVVNKKKKNSNV